MFITDSSSFVDLTMSDSEDDYHAAYTIETDSDPKALSKRMLSEDIIDHIQLQASIEQDVLHPTRTHSSWGFSRMSKPHTFSRKHQKSITPGSLNGSTTMLTPASFNNDFALNNTSSHTEASTQGFGPFRVSPLAQANTGDVQMLGSQLSEFFEPPAKRLRQTSTSKMTPGNITRLSSLSSTPSLSPTNQDNKIVIDIEALYPIRRPCPAREQAAIPFDAQIIDLDEETGYPVQDEDGHRLDAFESDYLDEEVLSVRNNIAQSIEKDTDQDAAMVANIRQLALISRRQKVVEAPKAKIFPLPWYQYGNHIYKAGKCVEMHDGTFLRIKSLHKDAEGEIWLVGDHLIRTNFQGPIMPKRRNEIVWVVVITDDGTDHEQAVVKRKLTEVVRFRRINFTNRQYEELNTKTHENRYNNPIDDIKFGELFCRIRRTHVKDHQSNRDIEESITLLGAAEADNEYRINANRLRDAWRGINTTPGGSFSEIQQTITLDGGIAQFIETKKLTFADCFCGGGGTTRGAVMAGLQVVWGFDCDQNAIMTYRANFGEKGTRCYKETVDEFLDRVGRLPLKKRKRYMVDILHISPPCQPFSPAHTIPNWENDAKNQACLFSIFHLLQIIKPRVVTVEETEGLISRHREWFSALIHIFVCIGYSVRWKVVHCEQYGVP